MDYVTGPTVKVYSFPNEDLDRQYMPDDFGEEASDHARVWKVYRDEAKPRDEKKLEGWNRTFDVLLTFAGLYSAALTAFLVESYKTLKQDSNDYTADILFRLVSLNPSANISLSDRASDAIRPPDTGYTPSTPMLWVNGLWFTSLALTLAVAFLCILVKQWLYEHERMLFDRTITARGWTRKHIFRSRALETWHIPAFVSALPTVLHIALFLFMAGLFVFLREFNRSVASLIAAIGGPVLLFFVIQIATPIWVDSCAWRSPFGRNIEATYRIIVAAFRSPARSLLPCFRIDTEPHERSRIAPTLSVHRSSPGAVVLCSRGTAADLGLQSITSASADAPATAASSRPRSTSARDTPLSDPEAAAINKSGPHLEAVALRRLLRSPTRNVVATAIQAIGSIRPNDPILDHLRDLAFADGDTASGRIRSYIVSRSSDMTSEERARNTGVMYEAMHCVRAWASLTKFDEQLVDDKSLFHNLYYSDDTLPLDVQVISALMSDYTPLEAGDNDFELSDIATIFRSIPYEPRRFRLHPSTLRLLCDIVGDEVSSERGISRRLISELAVLHGLFSICLSSWLRDPDGFELSSDFTQVGQRIIRRLELVKTHVGQISGTSREYWDAVSGLVVQPEEAPRLRIVHIWLAFSRFWLDTQYYTVNDSPATHTYTAVPNPEHIAASLLLLCRAPAKLGITRHFLGDNTLFWNVLLCPGVESYSWTGGDIIDLLDVYIGAKAKEIDQKPETSQTVDQQGKALDQKLETSQTVDQQGKALDHQGTALDHQGTALAALIRMAGSCLDRQQLQLASLECFRDSSARLFVDTESVMLSHFLAKEPGSCTWHILHTKVCSDGKANANVLTIAESLVKQLAKKPGDYIEIFFSGNALENCIGAAYEAWLILFDQSLHGAPDMSHDTGVSSLVSQLENAGTTKERLQLCREFMTRRTFTDGIPTLDDPPQYKSIIEIICSCADISWQKTSLAFGNLLGDALPQLLSPSEGQTASPQWIPLVFLDYVASTAHTELSKDAWTKVEPQTKPGKSTREFINFLHNRNARKDVRSSDPYSTSSLPPEPGPSH